MAGAIPLFFASKFQSIQKKLNARLGSDGDTVAWMPLCLLPPSMLLLRSMLPPWAFMWALAFSFFLGFKWLTWRRARASGMKSSHARDLAYLLLWPGMDAQAFLDVRRRPRRPPLSAWLVSAGQTLFGVGLTWGLVRAVPGQFELLQGWVGLVGLAFLLHFGSFQLIALFWQRVAIDAQPIMDSPLRAHSLGEFWGARWNSAFRHLSHALVYLPLREQIGSRPAVLAAFVASGLVHELVISLPAGAGFGLPTAYFLIQALGVLLERSSMTGRWRRPTPALGRAFALACSAAPAMVLFHPAFVRRVVLPFMAAIGAL